MLLLALNLVSGMTADSLGRGVGIICVGWQKERIETDAYPDTHYVHAAANSID